MSQVTVGIIGTGRAGTALGVALAGAGYAVVAGWSRSRPAVERFVSLVPSASPVGRPAEALERADLLVLTVPDSLIDVLAQALPWSPDKLAVHCSGSLSLDVLAPAAAEGAGVGSLHPLLPLASVESAGRLGRAAIAIEGDARTLPVLQEMASRIGGSTVRLGPGDKALYHSAAVLAGNYTVTLFDAALRLWEELGVDRAAAAAALLPLLRGVADNLEREDPATALTGPVARGDAATIRAHVAALGARAPELLPLYIVMARQTLDLALRGELISEEVASTLESELEHTFEEAKGRLAKG
ncbi:MAG: DUF2520 domain-containing protein [Dehalococcoidia bacterium]|nr:DUF2520 domain-containing protein [Dehalococcoidia bacterium]